LSKPSLKIEDSGALKVDAISFYNLATPVRRTAEGCRARNPPHSLVLHIALNESFNGDGTVFSYLSGVRRTFVKLRQWHLRLRSRTDLAVITALS
jgi:hypothetical protein